MNDTSKMDENFEKVLSLTTGLLENNKRIEIIKNN